MRTTDFSDRYELGNLTKETLTQISDELKTTTWNIIVKLTEPAHSNYAEHYFACPAFVRTLAEFFGITDDQLLGISAVKLRNWIRPKFLSLDGKNFYNLLNFLSKKLKHAATIISDKGPINFTIATNKLLEEKGSPCRFINFELTLSLGNTEMASVNESIESPYTKVNTLLLEAADYLFQGEWDKTCSSAVGAVESLLKNILNEDLIDFEKAVKKISLPHGAMKQSICSLWGYISQCARHKNTDAYPHEPNEADAKFVLVWCSAFINYVKDTKIK